MTQTLSAFLLARIAEDEALVDGLSSGAGDPDFFWGPDRIRAECGAKRQVLALHEIVVVSIPAYGTEEGVVFVEPDSFEDITTRRLMCTTCHNLGAEGPCPTLRALALPYADHPDYLEDWRP